jgi:catechol 2,3-dioxygenase-like lactoylglutathione lyase family enzyme
MGTSGRGIEGVLVETHNWGKTVAFWQGLGFELEFETDHHSGMLRHPGGGPYVFVAERAPDATLDLHPILGIDDPEQFSPPAAGDVEQPFESEHWGVTRMVLRDPDGRHVAVEAPRADADADAS